MKTLTYILLFGLLATAAPAEAARLSLEAPLAGAGAVFSIPVVITAEEATINAVEGAIRVPDGVIIDTIDTSGSAFLAFASGPSYVPASHAIEFTAGAPGGITGGSVALLFVIQAHAEVPGSYAFVPENINAYANDGKGTAVSVTAERATLLVGPAGSVQIDALPEAAPSPLIAEIGKDDSLFDGKWFATFLGGTSGSSVEHYEVREGWWRSPVRADRYYVLLDQNRTSTVWVTAIGENGKSVTVSVPAQNPWTERAIAAILLLVVGTVAGLIWRRFFRRPAKI